MNATEIMLLVMGVVIATVILICIAIPPFMKLAQKKGWNVTEIAQTTGEWLNKMDTISDILVKLNVPTATIFDKIIDVTKEAVVYAEQIYKAGQIAPEQRYDEAKKAIFAGLKLAGVPEDKINETDVQSVIEMGLESAVHGLGHSTEDSPVCETLDK